MGVLSKYEDARFEDVTVFTDADNRWEGVARLRKAVRLADALQSVGVRSDDVDVIPAEAWRRAYELTDVAGVHRPSPVTRRVVRKILAARENGEAVPAVPEDDPL